MVDGYITVQYGQNKFDVEVMGSDELDDVTESIMKQYPDFNPDDAVVRCGWIDLFGDEYNVPGFPSLGYMVPTPCALPYDEAGTLVRNLSDAVALMDNMDEDTARAFINLCYYYDEVITLGEFQDRCGTRVMDEADYALEYIENVVASGEDDALVREMLPYMDMKAFGESLLMSCNTTDPDPVTGWYWTVNE